MRGCSLDEAEEYGDCLTYGEGHYETWNAWRDGTLPLTSEVRDLRPIIAQAEYEEWPRGRVIYERSGDRFVVYADRQAFQHRGMLEKHLEMAPGQALLRTDPHYQSTRRLLAERGATA